MQESLLGGGGGVSQGQERGQAGGTRGRQLTGPGVAPMSGGQEGESKGHHNARALDAQRKISSIGPNRVRPPGLPAQGLGALEGMLEGQAEGSGLQASGRGKQGGSGRGKWGVGMRRGS